jgi:hypothetical protein
MLQPQAGGWVHGASPQPLQQQRNSNCMCWQPCQVATAYSAACGLWLLGFRDDLSRSGAWRRGVSPRLGGPPGGFRELARAVARGLAWLHREQQLAQLHGTAPVLRVRMYNGDTLVCTPACRCTVQPYTRVQLAAAVGSGAPRVAAVILSIADLCALPAETGMFLGHHRPGCGRCVP